MVSFENRPIPMTGFQSIVMLFLQDTRFHRWTYLEIYNEDRKLGKIDAHYLDPKSFKKLHSKLWKIAEHNKT